MDNWHVIRVWTGREKFCANEIRSYNEGGNIKNMIIFVPTKESVFKGEKEIELMFPSYVFVETPMDAFDFLDYFDKFRRLRRNFMQVLSYGDSGEIALRREEKLFLKELVDDEWCVKFSKGFKDGGTVTVVSGALMGCEAQIRKIDRHKMTAWVELEMLGRVGRVEVGLEVVTKI